MSRDDLEDSNLDALVRCWSYPLSIANMVWEKALSLTARYVGGVCDWEWGCRSDESTDGGR